MRYRKIDVRIWGDAKFRALTRLKPSGQALFLYLLTNPSTNVIPGLYKAGSAGMAEELNWSIEELINSLNEVISQGLVIADLNARVIFIPNAIKYNKPQSPNVITSWALNWDEIPECELKLHAYNVLKDFVYGLGNAYIKAFHKAIGMANGNTIVNQEQDIEQEQEEKTSSPDKDRLPNPTKISLSPHCPHEEIITLFHEVLPSLPKIKIWNETRRSHLQRRWRENEKHQDLEFWRKLFEYIKDSDFLMGRTENRDGKLAFICDLDWLIKPNNFAKVIEGKYHGGRS